ncbi:CHAT domain-containing protein [Armillaria fumosa]|nr:CHAT domain-containing protein [Armillaria fumosa]
MDNQDLIDFPTLWNNRGIHLLRSFVQFGREDVLQDAISELDRSASFISDSNPDKPPRLRDLCNAFVHRFQFLAIKLGNDAVILAGGDWDNQPSLFIGLSQSYFRRSEIFGNLGDLNSAVSAAELAVSASAEGHPWKPDALFTLANCLQKRVTWLGNLNDIESAIEMGRLAFSLAEEDELKSSVLKTIAYSFSQRFMHLGKSDDLEESISAMRKVVDSAPKSSPSRSTILSELSSLLRDPFAIVKGMDAVNAMPSRSPFRPAILNTLSSCFTHRFNLNGILDDLTQSISLSRSALSDCPDGHISKPNILHNLAGGLHHANDIDEAVSSGQHAVACTPDGDPEKPVRLDRLASSLRDRFRYQESITCGHEALSLIPNTCLGGSIELPTALYNSATLCPTGRPSERLKVDPPSALEAYKVVMKLLPRVAWTGKSIAARHRLLAIFAEWAIRRDEADAALECQLHNLRSPVDILFDPHPHLAERLSQVAVALEMATSRDVNLEHFKGLTMEDIAKEHRRLATEWDGLVEEVRALPGFEDFLGPKKLATLKNAAKLGPVVLLNISPARCDALIIIPALDDVIHIPLKNFSLQKAKILQEQLTKALSAFGVRTRASQPVYATSVNNVFMNVLKELWTCIVKPVLDGLAISVIWWCPTGPLAFLPIHAAGDYRTNEPGTKISDYVISSYTPTLTILLDKLEKTRTFKGLLAISQPDTPGLSSLPGTKVELQRIEERATKIFVQCLRGEEATPDTVLQGMSTCNWVHMACHTMQEKVKSLDSTFHLHRSHNYQDGNLPLSHIIAKSFPDADFAYLSACQTATGDTSLSEESVRLAVGMLMAGYRSVVATLWSIKDADAPLIADEVYSRLFAGDGKPDSGQAAIALHHAVQALRKRVGNEPGLFVRWVPFIHVGV